MPESTAPPQQQPSPAPWPAGVIARYITVGGATVDLTGGDDHTYLNCTGCGYGRLGSWWVERVARDRAQGHAEKCRALPRPEVNQ